MGIEVTVHPDRQKKRCPENLESRVLAAWNAVLFRPCNLGPGLFIVKPPGMADEVVRTITAGTCRLVVGLEIQ